MKKQKKKLKSWKIFKIAWLIIFILTIVWTLFWLAMLPLSKNLGEVIIFVAFFTLGIYALGIVIGISILILIIWIIVKLFRKRK